MAPFLPVQSLNRSQNIRIGAGASAVNLKPGVTNFVDLGDGPSKRDLQRHSAIGAILVVGGITASNSNVVVKDGGVVTAGAGLTVNVSAGDLRDRTTGVETSGAAATNHALTAADGTQDRTDLVWWDNVTGAVGHTNGTLASAGNSVAPATPAGKTPLAKVLVAATATVPGTITDQRPRG